MSIIIPFFCVNMIRRPVHDDFCFAWLTAKSAEVSSVSGQEMAVNIRTLGRERTKCVSLTNGRESFLEEARDKKDFSGYRKSVHLSRPFFLLLPVNHVVGASIIVPKHF